MAVLLWLVLIEEKRDATDRSAMISTSTLEIPATSLWRGSRAIPKRESHAFQAPPQAGRGSETPTAMGGTSLYRSDIRRPVAASFEMRAATSFALPLGVEMR